MGRFVRGKDLRASTLKSPTTFGDTQGGAILADSILSIGDINVIAGNITVDSANGYSVIGATASPGGGPTEIQFNDNGTLAGNVALTWDPTFGVTSSYGFLTSADVTANNVSVTTDVSTYTVTATGNVSGANLTTAGIVDATGNVSGGNLVTAGDVHTNYVIATGNISGGNLIVINSVYGLNVDVTGTIDAAGNVTGGNLVTAGLIDATGNVSGGNITTVGDVTATGNIEGGNVYVGTGNVDGGNINFTSLVFGSGNVLAGNLNTYASGTVSAGNITTTGNITAGNVSASNLSVTGSTSGIFKTAIVRLQKTASTVQIYDGWETPDIIQGNISVTSSPVSGTAYGLGGNYYFIFTLTGFTQIPYSIKAFDNLTSGGFGSADDINTGALFVGLDSGEGLSPSATGFLLGGTPSNIITTFDPSTHKYYMQIGSADINDWYVMFQGI